MVQKALEAKTLCSSDGIEVVVVNMLCVKPVNEAVLSKLKYIHNWVVAEDGCVTGGIGSTISLYATEKNLGINIKHIGIPDKFAPHGSIDEICGLCGMMPVDIYRAIKTF